MREADTKPGCSKGVLPSNGGFVYCRVAKTKGVPGLGGSMDSCGSGVCCHLRASRNRYPQLCVNREKTNKLLRVRGGGLNPKHCGCRYPMPISDSARMLFLFLFNGEAFVRNVVEPALSCQIRPQAARILITCSRPACLPLGDTRCISLARSDLFPSQV